MANHKSAIKRTRQAAKRTFRNKQQKSTVRTFVKRLRVLIAEKKSSEAKELFVKVQGLLGKLSSKGILKQATAARLTSRLATQVSKI